MALELRRKKKKKKGELHWYWYLLYLQVRVRLGCQVCGLTAAKEGEGLSLRTAKENYSVFMLLQRLSNWTNLKTKILVVWFWIACLKYYCLSGQERRVWWNLWGLVKDKRSLLAETKRKKCCCCVARGWRTPSKHSVWLHPSHLRFSSQPLRCMCIRWLPFYLHLAWICFPAHDSDGQLTLPCLSSAVLGWYLADSSLAKHNSVHSDAVFSLWAGTTLEKTSVFRYFRTWWPREEVQVALRRLSW